MICADMRFMAAALALGRREGHPQERLPEALDDVRVALLTGHDQRGIARQQMLQREDDYGHEEQRRYELQQPPAKECQHRWTQGRRQGAEHL